MQQIDLHVHSSCSDGTDSPEELVKLADSLNLSAFALTDHDTVDGISEAMAAAKDYRLEVIPGIEISSYYNNKEIHILGLYIDYMNEEFKKELDSFKNSRLERNLRMAEKFCENNIPVDYDEMLEMYPDAVITRAHFADYLLSKGYVASRNEAFERYLGDGRPMYTDRQKILASDAIKLIHNAGGTAILAHPVLYHLSSEKLNEMLKYLCHCGLDGIEAIYSTYSQGEEIAIRSLARQHHLLISGGSDYHGRNKPSIKLGSGRGRLFVPYDVLENIKKVNSHRGTPCG